MKHFLIFFSIMWSAACPAADVSVADRVATVSGLLAAQDISLISEPGIEKIVFFNSLGGTLEAALGYMELIKNGKIQTVVKGKCYSACALAFLSGKTRSVDVNEPVNVIMVHMARTVFHGNTKEYRDNKEVLALIDSLTDGKMRNPAREKIAQSWTEASGVAFIVGKGFFGERRRTVYCDGKQGFDTSKCDEIPNADPYDLGILTRK